jgi:hypothetical protein
MSHGEIARVRGTGREGLRGTQPVTDPPQHDAHLLSGAQGDLMASAKSTRVWEAAYRQYGRAWETTARSGKGDPATAREMAAASWAVAAAWRHHVALVDPGGHRVRRRRLRIPSTRIRNMRKRRGTMTMGTSTEPVTPQKLGSMGVGAYSAASTGTAGGVACVLPAIGGVVCGDRRD